VTDTNFAARLAAARKAGSLTQQQLADRSGAHVTQIRRYEAGTSQPTLDVLRALALALNVSADSLLFDDDERGPHNPTLRLKLEAVDQFTPDEQEHVAAFIEGAEFYPYAVVVDADGQQRMVAADTGDEQPASADLITTLIAALSDDRDHLRAAAIVADVRLPELGSDAIRVTLEHSEHIALSVLLPYKTRHFGRAIDSGDLQTEAAASLIWPS
jgi:transcriptional regulator with XRE-family HTH domain